jgi:hypothetical protein
MDTKDIHDELDKFLEELRKDPYGAIDSTNAKKVKYKFKQMDSTYYKNYEYGSREQNAVEQLNSFWQEIKKMQQMISEYRTIMVEQNIRITKLTEQMENMNNVDNDKIVELNDRVDDLESRIDLLDE